MKKSFLIAGLIVGLSATNCYADIVISQTEETPDITISVARAAKGVATRVTPKSEIKSSVSTASKGQNVSNTSSNDVKLMVRYACPEGSVVSLRGAQDDVNHNMTAEYATCVDSNNAYVGVPSAEVVGMTGGSIINSGKKPRDLAPTEADVMEAEWLAGGGYYDENGNPVNTGKKKR